MSVGGVGGVGGVGVEAEAGRECQVSLVPMINCGRREPSRATSINYITGTPS